MLKTIILDYSILGQHSRESALFSKKVRRQLTSLGHAGSPCFLSFCYLRCIVLTCTILGSVYLKTTGNLQKYINQSCSMPENSFNVQKYSNQCFSILGSVFLKSTVNLTEYRRTSVNCPQKSNSSHTTNWNESNRNIRLKQGLNLFLPR